MNENRKINSHDEGLRRAIARRELQLPHMPDDLNQRLMQRMGQRKAIARKRWLATVAASVAVVAFVAVLIGGWLEPPAKQDVKVVAQEGRQYETEATNKVIVKQKAATSVVRQAEKQTSPQENSIKAESKFSEEKITSVREEQKGTSISDSVRLTEDQKVMDEYVAQVSRICGATCLPLDCGGSDGKVFVFQDDEQMDVLGKLKNVVAWIDTDSPAVRLFSSFDQMTLELDGDKDAKGVNEIWFADRQYGYVYLYHARVRKDSWTSASCYTDFLDQNSRKLSN